MATLKMVAGSLCHNDFVVSLDLSDAYFHLSIDRHFRRFLRFKLDGSVYQFKPMPFGLCSAPHIFTMLTQAITLFCRRRGIRIIFYLDDTIIMARSRATAIKHRNFVMSLLQRRGFIINLAKSDLAPSQTFCFLGLNWDTSIPAVSLTEEKVSVLHSSADRILRKGTPSCRELQQFLGCTNFASFAVPRARLNSRAIQCCLSKTYKSPSHLFRKCPLSKEARQDLHWWVSFFPLGKPLHPPTPSESITTDASSSGWGATWGSLSLSGRWPDNEVSHINWLELRAIYLAFKQWGPSLRGKTVAVQSDNRTAVAYILREGGTCSRRLLDLTRDLLGLTDRWGITIRPSYIPGLVNIEADSLSCGKSVQEWCILPWIPQQIFHRWGIPQVDLFASSQNSQCDQFFSISR